MKQLLVKNRLTLVTIDTSFVSQETTFCLRQNRRGEIYTPQTFRKVQVRKMFQNENPVHRERSDWLLHTISTQPHCSNAVSLVPNKCLRFALGFCLSLELKTALVSLLDVFFSFLIVTLQWFEFLLQFFSFTFSTGQFCFLFHSFLFPFFFI